MQQLGYVLCDMVWLTPFYKLDNVFSIHTMHYLMLVRYTYML